MMQAQNVRSAPIHATTAVPPKAVPISRTVRATRTGPPVVTPVGPSRSLMALPLLSAICCLGTILFLIAATIVLALIPLYTSNKNVTPTPQRTVFILDVPLSSDSNIPVGPLNDQQKAIIQRDLQAQLNNDTRTKGSTVTVLNATAIAVQSPVGKRQARANTIRVAVEITIIIRIPPNVLVSITTSLTVSTQTESQLQAATTTTTRSTTRPTTTVATTTTNRTRRLVRRSLEEGGAPAGIVYVDAHQVAAMKGDVSSVSFYVDQTCASATVEFGAFELLSRDTSKNTAELRLVARSGPLKLMTADDLKPFMSLMTIRLCSGEAIADTNSGGCQGNRFPVLPHQYIGVRSDSCRLGYAPVTVDPRERVTWKMAGSSDPFEYSYDQLHYIPANYTVLHTVTIDSEEKKKSEADVGQISGSANHPRVLFLGSYPPRQCGLAKFLEDLTDAYPGPYGVVAVDEDNDMARSRTYSKKVVHRLNLNDRDGYYKVANLINSQTYDVLNIQHEYGLFGGIAGEYVIAMLAAVRKPIITTMHTVIPEPTTMYLSVTRALCATSTRVVVMSELGRHLLVTLYGVDETKISVVPHGVPDVPYENSLEQSKEALGFDPNSPTIATFGLVHRNKNVEFALKALKKVVESEPHVMYLVIGQTHPSILAYEGESYRHELESNVTALGLTKNVEFIDKYVSDDELLKYLSATDIYLTPYAREDQYVSGTLSWAVGLGKAVVSTPYMYAKELLADGRGFLVPFEDENSLATTLLKLIEDVPTRDAARRKAYKFGRHMTWPTVAIKMEQIFRELLLSS